MREENSIASLASVTDINEEGSKGLEDRLNLILLIINLFEIRKR